MHDGEIFLPQNQPRTVFFVIGIIRLVPELSLSLFIAVFGSISSTSIISGHSGVRYPTMSSMASIQSIAIKKKTKGNQRTGSL